MRQFAIGVVSAFVLLASQHTVTTAAVPRVVEIEACRIGLTASGQTASFAATAIYEADIDTKGNVSRLKGIRLPDFFDSFVRTADFESCMKRWRFSGAGRVPVIFHAGTTGRALKEWYITAGADGQSVRLTLPH